MIFRTSRAEPSAPPSGYFSAAYFAFCLLFCLTVQYISGAWSAGFFSYPDEPAHFVGSVMVRDWLVSGKWFSPLEFARNYYDHYPFFGIGYWPPLFSGLTGLWLLIAGVGRFQALVLPAVFAAGTGWLIFQFVRSKAGLVVGACAGALYLSLPPVQVWMCAVMVDHVTAFLCIASAACLLRYLRNPVIGNGILCALCCGFAILSKYNCAYIVFLPFLAVVFLRRFELLKKSGLLLQPLIIALMVGPWALWTRKMAFYGLPAESEPLTATRVVWFVARTFKIFPPVLMVVVILGLLILLLRPKAWRDDVVVLSLLAACHVALLIASPVPAELRYLLMPAAVLLLLAFAGWSEVRPALFPPLAVALGTILFVGWQLGHSTRLPADPARMVTSFIVNDPSRTGQKIVVPPTAEGPVIAEFVLQSRNRPDFYLLRPYKILAHSDWLSIHYSSNFSTPGEMMEYFRQNPVDLIVWSDRPEASPKPHALLLAEMLRTYPLAWQKIWSLNPVDGSPSWAVYEYHAP